MNAVNEMPWDEAAERGLLSCLLRVPALTFEVRDVEPSWFWMERHRHLWRALKECAAQEVKGNTMLVQVDVHLSKNGLLDRFGESKASARKWLRVLADESVSPHTEWSLRYEQLRSLWLRRSMIESASRLHDAALKPGNPDEVIAGMATALHGLGMRQQVNDGLAVKAWLEEIEASHTGKESQVRLPTGVTPFDDLLGGGISMGHYTVIAARPKVGKSRLAIRLAFNLLRSGVAVDFWSQEMTQLDMTDVFATCVTGIPGNELRQKGTKYDWGRAMAKVMNQLDGLPIKLRCGSAHVRDIVMATRARRAQLGDDVPMAVFVDYIQVFRGTGDKEYERITDVTQQLASLSRDSNVWVCGMAQFNRQAGTGMPKPHMLRGSGQIEQDVNELVIFHREAAGEEGASKEAQRQGVLWLALNRHGETKQVIIDSDAERMSFDYFGGPSF